MHMPKLWPLSQSLFTPAIQFDVCMHKETGMTQTPQIQPTGIQDYGSIQFCVLGSCSELGRCFTLHQPQQMVR